MSHGVICEPVDVSPDALVEAERVAEQGSVDPVEPFHHFHDVCEIVWFRRVDGNVQTEAGSFPISAGTAVFMPSMHSHDFTIRPGDREWILLHIDPSLVVTLMNEDSLPSLNNPICAHFDDPLQHRLDTVMEWILDAASDPIANRAALTRLIKLVLIELARGAKATADSDASESTRFARLRPALDLVARDTAQTVSLEEAASACHLSPAYFSRRFKSVLGQNYSDYVRTYRLRLAARRLIGSGDRISDIAFSLGFATPAHFTALFQKRFGMTPREYRTAARSRIE